jgi:hypothetical protein
MTWLELFRTKSFPIALAKRRSQYYHIDPILKGKELRQVKDMFTMVDLPFIYDDREVIKENNMNSPYHKRPKSLEKREKAFVKKVAKVRIGLFNAKEKELKWRQDAINKRKYKGITELLKKVMPFMIKQEASTKMGGPSGGKSKKPVAESVKGVPKTGKFVRRKSKEQFKEMMDTNLIDLTDVKDSKQDEANQKNKQKQDEAKRVDKRYKAPVNEAVKEIQEMADKRMKEDEKI